MATTTTNYGLTKPATTDNYDIGVPNGNMDKIDIELKKGEDHRNDTVAHMTQAQKNQLASAVPNTRKINGHTLTADVTVTAGDMGLDKVNNTPDANKSVNYANSAGTSTYANYPSHAVGLADFGLRGNYMSSASPSGGNDGDTWDQV